MPKATEGGASNAWDVLTCAECGAQVAAGAPRCPECPSTEFTAPEPAQGVEHPADGTMSPEVGNGAAPGDPEPEQVTQMPEGESAEPVAPAAPPRVPPRRTVPEG